MNQTSFGTKLLMGLLTLGVIAYFGMQGLQYYADPLSTTLAYTYIVEEGLDLTGYVTREEQLLPNEDSTLLHIQRAEGERVSKGGTVALAYADQVTLDRLEEIEDLTVQLEQLQYIQESALEQQASLKLDHEILRELVTFRRAVETDRLEAASDSAAALKNLVLKRDYTYSDTTELTEKIAAISSEQKTLQAQVGGSIRRVTAPVSGLYSGVVDGYETVLTPEILPELTPSRLSALEPDAGCVSGVGKLVLGDDWYYSAVLSTDSVEQLQKYLSKGDKTVTLRFLKDVERDLNVTLESIGPEENGRCVVTFRGDTYLPELTTLRKQSAKLIYHTIEGLRVPKEAIRARKLTVDNEGTETVTEALGVYCVVGMEARFKPVRILYSGENFTLVAPEQSAATAETRQETIRLRSGDEVILSARELYDGKIVG